MNLHARLPLLLNRPLIRQVANLGDTALLTHFGKLAERLDGSSTSEALLACASAGLGDAWRSLAAREILLAHSWGITVQDEVWTAFAAAVPFVDGPAIEALMGKQMAAAAFPADQADGVVASAPPPWYVLWLFAGGEGFADHSGRLEQWEDAAPALQGCSIFLTGYPASADRRHICHHSWTLAAFLAHRALKESTPADVRHRLASSWMITGHVKMDRTIAPVAIGTKIRVKTARSWMFPPDNRADVAGHAGTLGIVRFPGSVDAAWVLLSGKGITDGGKADWPHDCEVLHSFTSAAWQPVVCSALLSAAKRLVLWHSAEPLSEVPAQQIKHLFSRGFWSDMPPEVQTETISLYAESAPERSSEVRMAEIEQRIRAVIQRDLETGRTVLFNITQGNRMMALAVHAIAQLHPNLWLIYRDLDAEPFTFTVIRYEGLLPTTETIGGKSEKERPPLAQMVSGESWERLFFKPKPRDPDTAEQMRQILAATPGITARSPLLPA